MHNFYFENNGPIEKFLEISKDFSHNRCIEKPSKWISLIFCIFRLKSSLMSKTLSNFDFEIFDFTSTFPDSPTSFPVWCFPTWRSRQTLSLSRFETPKHNQFLVLNILGGLEIFKKMKTFLSFLRAPSGGQLLYV